MDGQVGRPYAPSAAAKQGETAAGALFTPAAISNQLRNAAILGRFDHDCGVTTE